MRFNGSAFVSLNRPIQNDMTIEVWVRASTPSTTGAQFWQGIPIVYADLAGTFNDFGTTILNDHFSFGLGIPPASGDQTVEGTSTVTTGEWVHLAATRTQSTGMVEVFVNGVLESSRALTNVDPLADNATLMIGGNTIDNRYFVGDMDEVRLWTVVRSAEQISSTMHGRVFGDEPGLAGYFRFDDAGSSMPFNSSTIAFSGSSINVDWVPSDAPICGEPVDPDDDAAPDAGIDPDDAGAPDAGVAGAPDAGVEPGDEGNLEDE